MSDDASDLRNTHQTNFAHQGWPSFPYSAPYGVRLLPGGRSTVPSCDRAVASTSATAPIGAPSSRRLPSSGRRSGPGPGPADLRPGRLPGPPCPSRRRDGRRRSGRRRSPRDLRRRARPGQSAWPSTCGVSVRQAPRGMGAGPYVDVRTAARITGSRITGSGVHSSRPDRIGACSTRVCPTGSVNWPIAHPPRVAAPSRLSVRHRPPHCWKWWRTTPPARNGRIGKSR